MYELLEGGKGKIYAMCVVQSFQKKMIIRPKTSTYIVVMKARYNIVRCYIIAETPLDAVRKSQAIAEMLCGIIEDVSIMQIEAPDKI